MNGTNPVRSVAEIFPPAVLFCNELGSGPALDRELMSFLDKRGVKFSPQSSCSVMVSLKTNIHEDDEDRKAAVGIFSNIISTGRFTTTEEQIGGPSIRQGNSKLFLLQ